jgi:hypothetical protein
MVKVKATELLEKEKMGATIEDDGWVSFLEDYRERLKKYCYAAADIPIKKNEDGYYIVDGLNKWLYILGGNFDENHVADEINEGDFPFDKVYKEGYWHFEFLLIYRRGDYEEPSYMELLHTEATFNISFEDQKKQDEEYSKPDDFLNF